MLAKRISLAAVYVEVDQLKAINLLHCTIKKDVPCTYFQQT